MHGWSMPGACTGTVHFVMSYGSAVQHFHEQCETPQFVHLVLAEDGNYDNQQMVMT